VAIDEGAKGPADPPDGFAEILASMSCHEHKARSSTLEGTDPRAAPRGDPSDRIDHGVAGQIDCTLGARPLVTKVFGRSGRRRKVQFSDLADDAPHELLWKRARADPGPKSSLDMRDGLLAEESPDGRGHRAGRVTLNDDDVRPLLINHSSDSGDHCSRDIFQALVRSHNVEIVLGMKVEDPEHLIEHFAVLCGHTHHWLNIRPTTKL
jgi:hypothetical protein